VKLLDEQQQFAVKLVISIGLVNWKTLILHRKVSKG